MSLDVNALRSFLVASPRPAKILITSGDGEQQEVLPPKGVGGVTWAGVARSIETLDPAVVELFDGEDKLIRAQRFDAQAKDSPELPAILARDAESARLAHFGNLLAQAHKFAVETAFTKMVEVFERLDRRQELIETRLERTEANYRRVMQEQIDAALESAEDARREAEEQPQVTDPAGAIVQAFMGGATQGRAQPAPTPNGKASAK